MLSVISLSTENIKNNAANKKKERSTNIYEAI